MKLNAYCLAIEGVGVLDGCTLTLYISGYGCMCAFNPQVYFEILSFASLLKHSEGENLVYFKITY